MVLWSENIARCPCSYPAFMINYSASFLRAASTPAPVKIDASPTPIRLNAPVSGMVGSLVGVSEGTAVGSSEGTDVGSSVGTGVGSSEGSGVGSSEGTGVGSSEGTGVGSSEGSGEGVIGSSITVPFSI